MNEKDELETAKEMFEELGYKKAIWKDNPKNLCYRFNDGGYITQVVFRTCPFNFVVFEEWEEYNDNKPQGRFTADLDLMVAINKQMKELGWLNNEQ